MPFIKISEGFSGCDVVCGPSVNLELTVSGQLPQGNYRLGKKNPVERIDHFIDRGQVCRYLVDLFDGSQIEIPVEETPVESHAGSSVNVAMAMRQWHENVGVFAPVGPGTGGATIRLSLENAGVDLALFNGMRSTPRTLTVRQKTGGSTLFMVKPPYEFSDGVLHRLMGHHSPKVLVGTGVKPQDLSLMVPLFMRKVGHFRALTPSQDLIFREDLRAQLLLLTINSDLLQVNEDEALALMGETKLFTPENTEEYIQKLQRVTHSALVVVTLSERGSVLYDSASGQIFRVTEGPVAIDSSGAGDAHLSALIWGMFLRQRRLDCGQALRLAAFVAGRKCMNVGPWSGLPSRVEIEEFLGRS